LWIKQRDKALATTFAKRLGASAWVHGQDIDEEAASALATELGIDAAQLSQGIKGDDIKAALRGEVDLALSRGVFGVPFFFIDDEPFWGVDRLWMMEHWLRHGRWDHDDVDRPSAPV
jgi:2-hydroxychromene-2-carboxylate isomerase